MFARCDVGGVFINVEKLAIAPGSRERSRSIPQIPEVRNIPLDEAKVAYCSTIRRRFLLALISRGFEVVPTPLTSPNPGSPWENSTSRLSKPQRSSSGRLPEPRSRLEPTPPSNRR